MVAIGIGIMGRWQITPKVNTIPTVSERQNTFLAYRFFIISWLLIIMIGPSVSFLVMHYNHEKLLARYACLIADVQKLREKTNGGNSEMKDPLYYSVLDSAVQKVNTDKASVCDPTDLVYYNQLPQFAFLNTDNTSLDFKNVPQMSGLMISRYGNNS
jgi:hypothetical protein